ncbi:MAG: PDZ domain-containing protein [Pirellulales bacterium]
MPRIKYRQPRSTFFRRVLPTASALMVTALYGSSLAFPQTEGQFPPSSSRLSNSRTTPTTDARQSAAGPAIDMAEEVNQLSSLHFRRRELARWRLKSDPVASLAALSKSVAAADVQQSDEIISLLSDFATLSDPNVSVEATNLLAKLAAGRSSITTLSFLAKDAESALIERQETLALAKLSDMHLRMGPLQLHVNGVVQNLTTISSISLHITDSFNGTDDDMRLLQFLRSVDTVYVERTNIPDTLLKSIAAMPKLKRLVFRGPGIQNRHLIQLKDMHDIEHFELAYTDITDAAIPAIEMLPVTQSMQILGTKITQSAGEKLVSDLEDLSVTFSRGGFLGISPETADGLRVGKVVRGTAADLGGIQAGDLLTHVDSVPIKTFTQLRQQLAKHAAGETVMIQLDRPRSRANRNSKDAEVMTLPIILRERPVETNQ